ncbi:MAG: hypothetical protein LAT61_05385 [Alcanivorax sp.]|nr:hypothetical protein [Alcanivorax sp.]
MRHCKTGLPRLGTLCLTLILIACHPAPDTPAFSDQYLLVQTVSLPGGAGELTSEAILQADYFTRRSGKRDRLHVTPKWFSIDPPYGRRMDTAAPADYMLDDEMFVTLLDWMFAGTTLHLDAEGGIEQIEPGDEAAHAQIMARMPDNLGALYEQAPMLMRLPDDITRGQYWEETRNMGDGSPLTLTITVLDFDDDEVLLALDAGDPSAALASDTPQLPLAQGRMILRRDGDWPVELRLHMYLAPEHAGDGDKGATEEPVSYSIRLASTTFSRFGFHDRDAIPEPDWARQRLETPSYHLPSEHELGWVQGVIATDPDALQALKKSTYWIRDGDDIRLHSDPMALFGYHLPMVTLRAARLLDQDGTPLPIDTLTNRRFEQHFYSNDIWLRGHSAPLIVPDPRTRPDLASTLGRIELDLDIAVMHPRPVAHLDHGANADSVPGLAEVHWHDQGVDLAIRGHHTLIAVPLDQDGNVIPFDAVYLPDWMLAQLDPSQQDGVFDPDVAALTLENARHEVRVRTETPPAQIAIYLGEAEMQRHTLVYHDGNDPDPDTADIRRYHRPAAAFAPESLPPPEDGLDMAARVAALAPTCTECDAFHLRWPEDTPVAVARMCELRPDEDARYYGNPLSGYLGSTRGFSGDGSPVTELRTADEVMRHFHDLAVNVTLRCPAHVTYVTEAVEDSQCVTAVGRSSLQITDTQAEMNACAALHAALDAGTHGSDVLSYEGLAYEGLEALDDLGFPLAAMAPQDGDTTLRFHGPISHVRYPLAEGEVVRQWSLQFPPLPIAPLPIPPLPTAQEQQ